MTTRINPSILAADWANLEHELGRISSADLVHVEKAGKSLIYHLKLSVLEDALLGFAETFGIARDASAPVAAPAPKETKA